MQKHVQTTITMTFLELLEYIDEEQVRDIYFFDATNEKNFIYVSNDGNIELKGRINLETVFIVEITNTIDY